MKKYTSVSRRDFLVKSAAAIAATSVAPQFLLNCTGSTFHAIPKSPLPQRVFGRTGAELPILTFGCGSRWFMNYNDEEGLKALNYAIDNGMFYIDTAHVYGEKRSEERIGQLMPSRRKEVLIQTKIFTRDKNEWWDHLELSLKKLNVDYVDMLMIHDFKEEEDLQAVEQKGGPVELLFRAKEEKLTRWIGISSHTNGRVLAKFLQRHKVDGVQMALNVSTNGPFDMGFEETALHVAKEQDLGIIAMKVMGQDQIVGRYSQYPAETCLRYSLSLPVTTATVGMPEFDFLKNNLETVRQFKPFSDERMLKIKRGASNQIKTAFLDIMKYHDDLV